MAGLTVTVMLVPQSMAYAMLAGIPPIYGLYASLVPLLVYSLFGTSFHLAFGAVTIDMLIVAAGLSDLAEPGTERYVRLAIMLTLLTGGIQLLMALFRLGFIVNLLSRPVIAGFTSAAALIIGFSQLGNFVGIMSANSQYPHLVVWEIVRQIEGIHLLTLTVGLTSIAILLAMRRRFPTFPAALVVVVLGIVAVWSLGLEGGGLTIVGEIPRGLPSPLLPTFEPVIARELLPTAITLALVQLMTVTSLGKVFAARYGYWIRPNRELAAIGLANTVGSLFQSLPSSGSFSRTAVNEQHGARSPLANAVAALFVAVTLLFLTRLFYYLPIPVLAAIVMNAAFGMIDVKEVKYLLRTRRVDGILAILTFVATLLLGIQEGILAGIAASVALVMYRSSRPNVPVLGWLPDTRSFRDVRHHPEARAIPGILILRIDASFSFANAEFVKDRIFEAVRRTPGTKAVVLDAVGINHLDTTAVAVLEFVADTLHRRNVELYFAGLKDNVYQVIARSGLLDKIGEDHLFLSPYRAVSHILSLWGASLPGFAPEPGR